MLDQNDVIKGTRMKSLARFVRKVVVSLSSQERSRMEGNGHFLNLCLSRLNRAEKIIRLLSRSLNGGISYIRISRDISFYRER